MTKPVVGFIGTGIMGCSMASHLMAAGFDLQIYNRTQEKATSLIEKGAKWHDTPADLAPHCDIIITMVGYPKDVEAIYFGPQGLIARSKADTLLIDMTTSSPALARWIASEAEACQKSALDAPVSGGDVGAREARLSIMVGGEAEAFQKAYPLFEAMGKQILHMGTAGMGQHTKMSNQIAIASNMMGVCESLVYAEKNGLDPALVFEAISAGAANSASLTNLAPRMLKGDYAPGFFIKHFLKDMKIAIESAQEANIDLPGLKLACSLYESLAEQGAENDGTQALIKWYKEACN